MSDFELPAEKKQINRGKTPPTPISQKSLEDKIEEALTIEDGGVTEKPKSKYTEEQLLVVFDEMIFNNGYEEKVDLRGGKLKVAFRTRTTEEHNSITEQIDSAKSNLLATLSEKRQLLNLHYSLTKYQGQNLSMMKHADRVKFIAAMPGPMTGLLILAMQEFDQKVYEACKYGEENENF